MNLTEKSGHLGIDKQEIDQFIAAKNFVGINRSPRTEKVIVSLTSYKPRIHDVKYTIFSLLNQNFPPDKLILWLDEDSFPQREKDLPRDLLDLKNFGLTIDWCENLRPYKKLIPALEKFPNDIIVTADDDIFYLPDWLKILYEEHLKSPECVIAHRAHRIRFDAHGNIFTYTAWTSEIQPISTSGGGYLYDNFFTGGGGVLYLKKLLHGDILKREIFTELAPIADDIWFWAMAVLNGTKIKIPAAAMRKLIYVDLDTQLSGETLWSKNKTQNDLQIRRIIEKYPTILEKLIRETVTLKPYISVVMPLKNPQKLSRCIENIFTQKFPDFELIIVNCGLRIELSPLPTNFHVINYPGANEVDAFKLGLQKATGDYVLFKDENSVLARESLEIAAWIAENSKSDVIHFAGHIQINGNMLIFDDAPELRMAQPVFFDAPRQIRAALWLQNKFSRRLDTKIFRREFLTKHELTFDGGIDEFLFRTLIDAEKYLIVPQAFCLE